MDCIITGCANDATHQMSVRLRRPETSAIWAPNTYAYLCDIHAVQGLEINMTVTPTVAGTVTINVSGTPGPGGPVKAVTRTTPITNPA